MNLENFICHKIKITQAYEKGLLGGAKDLSFVTNDIEIRIKQIVVRTVELSYDQTGDFDRLYSTFCQLEKLFVLFEGEFLDFKKIIAYDCNGKEMKQSQLFEKIKSSRLNYCSTIDACRGNTTSFLDAFKHINADIFSKWCNLVEDLDIIHQVFLYNTSSIGLTIDAKIASVIEVFEPLVELITEYTNQFSSLKPGEKGTTLKMCLDAIISMYGKDIFDTAYSKNAGKFLQILVNSRIKVMHIKRNFNQVCLSGEEAVLYIVKLSFLYRNILCCLLGIEYCDYRDNLVESVKKWETWENVFSNFINNKLN